MDRVHLAYLDVVVNKAGADINSNAQFILMWARIPQAVPCLGQVHGHSITADCATAAAHPCNAVQNDLTDEGNSVPPQLHCKGTH